jgi:hypothetical protein
MHVLPIEAPDMGVRQASDRQHGPVVHSADEAVAMWLAA